MTELTASVSVTSANFSGLQLHALLQRHYEEATQRGEIGCRRWYTRNDRYGVSIGRLSCNIVWRRIRGHRGASSAFRAELIHLAQSAIDPIMVIRQRIGRKVQSRHPQGSDAIQHNPD